MAIETSDAMLFRLGKKKVPMFQMGVSHPSSHSSGLRMEAATHSSQMLVYSSSVWPWHLHSMNKKVF